MISDPVKNRNLENLDTEDARVVGKAKRSAGSKSGKALLRRRGMHLERSFAHILDAGGAGRTTLRGLENLNKRLKVSAAIYNLSQLMRKLFGVVFRFTINWERFIVIIREKMAAGVRIIREGLSRKQREAEVGETWIRVSVSRVVL